MSRTSVALTLSALALSALGLAAAFPRSAAAAPESNWTIYSSQLTPAERARFFAAPLGNTDPFGNPVPTGCTWSRMQIPTAQGLEWVAEEDCNPNSNER